METTGMGEREIGMGKRERERQGWERKIERDNSGRERDREIGRETGVGEIQGRKRERERDKGEKERQGGEREKITNTKKFMEFYLVVLHSVLRSEARQWIVHDKCRASIRLPEIT